MRPVLLALLALAAAVPATAGAAPRHGDDRATAHPPVAAPAAAKVPNRLRVSGLPRAGYATAPGATLTVRGRVRNTARRRATPTVSLFAMRRGSGRIALGAARIGRVRARRSARFAVKVRVPAALGAGRYGLRACVRVSYRQRARCTPARRLLLSAPAGSPAVPATLAPAPPAPAPGSPAATPPRFTDGARSIGDSLFPQIGNGGYDARHYALDLAYTPADQVLVGDATMTAAATQDLASFSMDLEGLQVAAVAVDGAPAAFRREATKLVVTPSAGIPTGTAFTVRVTFGGVVAPVIDPDGSQEGFVPTATGAVVVCEPLGAQGWFPNNNTPRDKATMDLRMTVPKGLQVIGNGTLVDRAGDATTDTFRWREAQPMATYLSTATIGAYDVQRAASPLGGVPLVIAVDTAANGASAAATPAQVATAKADLLEGGEVIDFFAGLGGAPGFYGAYPFETSGGIVANAPDLGYALEVQGRPVYTNKRAGALVHELAHQWWGDSATLTDWRDIWLAEGFAVWSEWFYEAAQGGRTPAQAAAAVYARPGTDDTWDPLIVTDPAQLFGTAPYDRGATMLEALRQVIGDAAFRSLLREYLDRFAYGNATTADFTALAQARTTEDLGPFFADWLSTDGRPSSRPPSAAYAG